MSMPFPMPVSPGTNLECQTLKAIFDVIGDKWTIPTVLMLANQPLRFNELKRLIGGVSQQMLTRTLKALHRKGMITRTIYPTVPPQVEYGLSDLGESFAEAAIPLTKWVLEHRSKIEASELSYDEETRRQRR